MKLTNEEIHEAGEAFGELVNTPLPMKQAYALAKLASKLSEQGKIIEQVRVNLVKLHGHTDGKNITISPGSEGFAKFTEEFGELLDEVVDITEIDETKLPIRLTGEINIAAKVFMPIQKFVVVE